MASEIEAWSGHGQKLTFYEDVALVELAGAAERRTEILEKLGGSVLDDRLEGFLIASDPDRVVEILEAGLEVLVVVRHPEARIAGPPGSRLAIHDRAARVERARGPVATSSRKKIRLESEDLVGVTSSDPDLLESLHRALRDGARTCERLGDDRMILSASSLPQLRAALRRLSNEYDVDLQR